MTTKMSMHTYIITKRYITEYGKVPVLEILNRRGGKSFWLRFWMN